MNNHKQACELGEQALSDALEKIDDVDEETFRDAKSIIELLKENLSLWKEEEEQNNVEDLWEERVKCWFRLCPKCHLMRCLVTNDLKVFISWNKIWTI